MTLQWARPSSVWCQFAGFWLSSVASFVSCDTLLSRAESLVMPLLKMLLSEAEGQGVSGNAGVFCLWNMWTQLQVSVWKSQILDYWVSMALVFWFESYCYARCDPSKSRNYMAQMFATPGYCMVLPAMDWIDATRPPNVAVACATDAMMVVTHLWSARKQSVLPCFQRVVLIEAKVVRTHTLFSYLFITHFSQRRARRPQILQNRDARNRN
jgi:hypothetical protein